MSEMVERVAKAIYEAALEAARDADEYCSEYMAQVAARAAIEAMREPTKDMVEAGWPALEDAMDSDYSSDAEGNRHSYSWIISGSQTEVYRAMIAAALKEPAKAD